jgi:hypothetical protein
MSNTKNDLINEVFELELYKKLKEKFPNENLDRIVVETMESLFGKSQPTQSNVQEVSNKSSKEND